MMKKLILLVFAGVVGFSGLAHAVVDETVTVKASGTEQPATTITIQGKTADNKPVGHPVTIHVSKTRPVAKEHYKVAEKREKDKVAYFDYTVNTGGTITTGRKTRDEFLAGGFDLGGGLTVTTEPVASTLTSGDQPISTSFINRWNGSIQPSGFYMSGAVGGSVLNDFRENVGYNSYLKIPTDAGPYVSYAVGYEWANHFRTELELSYDHHAVAQPYYGNTTMFTGSVNGLYDFSAWNNLVITVGGGVGAASFNYCTGASPGSCSGRTVTSAMGVAIGEVSYPITQNAYVFVRGEGHFFEFDKWYVKCVEEEMFTIGLRAFAPPN